MFVVLFVYIVVSEVLVALAVLVTHYTFEAITIALSILACACLLLTFVFIISVLNKLRSVSGYVIPICAWNI